MFSSSAPGRPITTRLAKRPAADQFVARHGLIAREGGALQRRQQLLEGALRFQRPCLHPVVGQPREERHRLHGDVGLVLVMLREMHGIDGAVEQRGDPRGQAKRHDGIRAAFGNRKNGFVQASPPTTTPQTTVTARCVKGPRLPGQRREMIACCIFPWDVFLGSTSWVVATPGGSGSPVWEWYAVQTVGAVRVGARLDVDARGVGRRRLLCRAEECHRAGRDLDGSRQRMDDRQQLDSGDDRPTPRPSPTTARRRPSTFRPTPASRRWSSPPRRPPTPSP